MPQDPKAKIEVQKIISDIRAEYGNVKADDVEEIQSAVESLFNRLKLPMDKPAPLPVVRVLQLLGFELFRVNFPNPKQSGLIAVDSSLPEKYKVFKSDRVVLVNGNDNLGHQRFTIAHELSHYIFDYDEAKVATYYKSYFTDDPVVEEERRANRFAAELLMPTESFKKAFNKIKKEQGEAFSLPATITSLMQTFGVSSTAVSLRLKETKCF